MEDEIESGVRAHLNFGHTFAHAIEATAGYGQVAHGQAVGLGMIAASHLAESIGLCPPGIRQRIATLLEQVGLPTTTTLPPIEQLLDAMKLDKKVADQRIRFILPDRMGHVIIRDDIPPNAIATAWQIIQNK